MNKYHCILFLLLSCLGTNAQNTLNDPADMAGIYGGGQIGIQNNRPVLGGELFWVSSNHLGISADANYSIYRCRELPPNYQKGTCFFGNCLPQDKVLTVSLMGLYQWSLKNPRLSLGVLAGPSLIKYDSHEFFRSEGAGFDFFSSGNYDFNEKTSFVPGLNGKVRLTYRLRTHMAAGCAIFTNLNNAKVVRGFNLSLTFGRFRN
ncbi:hypothetical protein [Dyadobacter arcticus]|uniref:Outer membrane protein beta-barrel domain-containing protein n=1 Tax=Dyadobacter arcticus TaxID=1078754 RepID=A0ABX0UUH9_9BACT|nr:hypothetical protein [Dyadobacter arcticus]NIJ55415.1 hypothetical protein [Dyadobacter arcticus]